METQEQITGHTYDAPGIGPREFLLAVLHDRSLPDDVRSHAATCLQEYDLVSGYREDFPTDKRPLDYVAPPPKTKRKHRKSKVREPVSRYDWQFLKSTRDIPARPDVQRLRDRVVIRNPAPPRPRTSDIPDRA
jgi:hypothetical protein